MVSIHNTLNFYKRKDIRQAMVEAAGNREVAIRFGEGFGKRPDVLKFPEEILDLVKEGATSFHASEELWENPKLIRSDLKKTEMAKLRRGWDLILDIDSPFWKISKITAWLIVRGLEDLGVSNVSVKFSGNKGFHIGVAFESFPSSLNGEETKNMFPEAPRNIASYLLDYITKKYIEVGSNNEIVFGKGLEKKFKISYEKLQELTGKSIDDLTSGGEVVEESIAQQLECPKCGEYNKVDEEAYLKCTKCGEIIRLSEKEEVKKSSPRIFNPLSIIEVDTILISSRHLFRMPYSLHEKSGLVSIPFNPSKVLKFEKKFASTSIAKVSPHKFIDREKAVPGEAKELLERAMKFKEKIELKQNTYTGNKVFEDVSEAIPEILFPPTIKKILEGLEDGKKRALFVLVNFLQCVGWDFDKIEERLREWNKKNPEPLREQMIVGQIRYKKQNKEKILPPNYDKDYYSGIGIKPTPEEMKFKNPVTYTIKRARRGNKRGK